MLRLIGVFTNQKENFHNKLNMAIKVNDHVIPDWAMRDKPSLSFKVWRKKWRGNRAK